jgi:hypothetical protein
MRRKVGKRVERMSDFSATISPALSQALDEISSKKYDSLTPLDVQVICDFAVGTPKDKAYTAAFGPKDPDQEGDPVRAFFKRPEVVSVLRELKRRHLVFSGVDYGQKLELLWNMAQFCTTTMFDEEGNELMKNPGAAKAAIAEMNRMSGDLAPEKKEMVIKRADLSEAELMAKIANLTAKLDESDKDVIDITPQAEPVAIEGPADGT